MNARWIPIVVLLVGVAGIVAACCCDGPFCEIPACDPCAPKCDPCAPKAAAPVTPPAPPASAKPAEPVAPAVKAEVKVPTIGKDVAHMHNVHQITPRFVRGSQAETEEDFAALAQMGVKVVVSVDGARPNVEDAHKHGLRYVHVPMGYDGPTREEQVLLYKAFTTLEGPFYVHCHHGKHRGPAACAIGLMADGWTAEQIVGELKRAGTAAKYEGLYAFPATFQTPTAEELAAVTDIPEVAPVAGLVASMILVDQGWERLGAVRKAKWTAPPDHPDVAPRHEATIFAQRFREMARLDEVTKAKADMLKHALDSEKAAWDLAEALGASPVNALGAEEAYARIEKSCTACHKQFRDTPTGAAAR